MIRSFRHRGLRRLFEQGDRSRIGAEQLAKVQRVLARLDALRAIDEMDLPGFRLHALHGDLAGFWSISITGNWRIVFRFEGGDVFEVDDGQPRMGDRASAWTPPSMMVQIVGRDRQSSEVSFVRLLQQSVDLTIALPMSSA